MSLEGEQTRILEFRRRVDEDIRFRRREGEDIGV